MFLLFTFLWFQAHAKPLCQIVLADDPHLVASHPTPESKAQWILQNILKSTRLSKIRPENPYIRLSLLVKPPRTLHSFENKGAWGKLSGGVHDDASMVLNLPPANAVTVWSLLSADEKISLARTLAETFQNGDYDHKVSGDHLDASGPLLGLNRALMRFIDIRFGEANNPETRELEREMKVGISPRRLLKAASQGEVSGVCRTTNSAFVGLLGELGAKNEEIRLVITRFYNDDGTVFSTHMHSELRNPHNETNWMKFDATPFPKQLSVNQESWIKELRTKRKEILPFITDFLIPKNY